MAEHHRQDHLSASRDPALRALQSVAFLVGMGVCLILALVFALATSERAPRSVAVGSGERINPNEAPVASLMRLPQIGTARARAIVAQRERHGSDAGGPPVFRKAEDLQQIKGIGPAIVEEVRPWLQFDVPPQDANGRSEREPPRR
jgi:competence ComEA-like helix-hairpin-helix protein